MITDPMAPTDKGLALVPYNGADAGEMTVGGELNQVAADIPIGCNIAGLQWRSDYTSSLLLGEP